MTTTPILGLTHLEPEQALPDVVVNEGVTVLEGFAGFTVLEDRSLTAPPGSPSDGQRYLIAATATGAWTGHDGEIAYRINGAWEYFDVFEGLAAWVKDENALVVYNGSAWATPTVPAESYGSGWNGSNEVPTKNDVYDKIEALIVGTGATAWALVGTGQTATGVWDFAVDGAKTNVDFAGLGSYNELKIIIDAVTGSAGTANRTVRVSTDNGSTFYSTSGDYVETSAAGTVTNRGACSFLSGATASASTAVCRIGNTKGAIKAIRSTNPAETLFRASASDINAVRITTTTADTLNGGKIYVYGR